ncbi:MAG: hypothetical protein HRU20_27270 [Pseudomonadales bacterium]|nr:hypothetical protein [Pseudomonadales bacterium]
MNIKDLENVLPIYHKAEKTRNDLLSRKLILSPTLEKYSEQEMLKIISNLEELISLCVEIAQDHLYGAISDSEAEQRIREKTKSKNIEYNKIIFERAKYYASR